MTCGLRKLSRGGDLVCSSTLLSLLLIPGPPSPFRGGLLTNPQILSKWGVSQPFPCVALWYGAEAGRLLRPPLPHSSLTEEGLLPHSFWVLGCPPPGLQISVSKFPSPVDFTCQLKKIESKTNVFYFLNQYTLCQLHF